jgi:CRISPR/Cas system-associated exonuclease Cas4 (RecB family)
MIYSYSQISQYLRCPRGYRHRYLDGWREKDSRAALLFGRCFEKAHEAYFLHDDSTVVLSQEWGVYREAALEYSSGADWAKLFRQGIELLERLAQDDRVRVRQPRHNLQVKLTRTLATGDEFLSYIDAIGELDGTPCLIDWKTTSSRYPEGPDGLLSLDPQLVCYSWMSGISDVALVVFVRKRQSEIQYLRATITEEQRREFGELVEATATRIGGGDFLPHSGIRFPQNGCVSCPFLGICLGSQALTETKLARQPGASELDWVGDFDE